MITLRCRGYADVLQQDVMSEQFTAKLAGGLDFASDMIGIHAQELAGGVTPAHAELKTTLGGSGTRRTPLRRMIFLRRVKRKRFAVAWWVFILGIGALA